MERKREADGGNSVLAHGFRKSVFCCAASVFRLCGRQQFPLRKANNGSADGRFRETHKLPALLHPLQEVFPKKGFAPFIRVGTQADKVNPYPYKGSHRIHTICVPFIDIQPVAVKHLFHEHSWAKEKGYAHR